MQLLIIGIIALVILGMAAIYAISTTPDVHRSGGTKGD
jgi:hypothetical protein